MKRVGLLTLVATAVAVLPAAASAAPQALKRAHAPAAQLDRVDTTQLPGGAIVKRFGQEIAGIPVVGAGAVVIEAPGEPAELLFDKSVGDLAAPGGAAVSRRDALAAALEDIGRPSGGRTVARLVIAADHGNRLAWEVSHSDGQPIMDWLVTVDADDGTVLARVDLVRRATVSGEAKLFVPNPVVAQGSYFKLRDRGDRNTARLTKSREPVDLERIKEGQSCLRGPFARATLGPDRKQVCKDSLKWNNIKRAANKFEALMAFFHVTSTQQYIRTLDLPPINKRSQRVVANPVQEDNSYYIPSRDEIQLGTGGVDDAEDADVIVHEYGHAVQDDQNPDAFRSAGNDVGAMGEGFGDYLAAAYSTESAGFDDEWTPCIMEWDATSYDDNFESGICLRRADIGDTLPQRKSLCGAFNIHCVGQVWSSALLGLRQALGDDIGGDNIMDKILLTSHEALLSNPSFEEGSEALIAADEMLYGGDNCIDLAAELEARLLDPDASSLC